MSVVQAVGPKVFCGLAQWFGSAERANRSFLSVALTLAVCCVGDLARAATYYVAKTGSNARSCESAKNPNTPRQTIMGASGGMRCLTTPGDRLMIRAGNYRENVSNFEIIPGRPGSGYFAPSGTSWANAFTVQAYPGERVDVRSIFLPTRGDGDPAVCVARTKSLFSYWTFDGINVDYGPGALNNPIWMRCPDHIRFMNMEVNAHRAERTCVVGGGHHIELINMNIHHCGDPNRCDRSPTDGHCKRAYGIYMSGDDLLVDRSKISDVRNYGIHFFQSNCNDLTLNCPDRAVVSNSVFWNVALDPEQRGNAILFSGGNGHRAVNNVIHSVGGAAMEVSFGARAVKLINNTVYDAKGGGIVVSSRWGRRGVEDVSITNNIISQTGSWGVRIADSGKSWGPPDKVMIRNNLLFGNTVGSISDKGAGTVKEVTLAEDPRFVNAVAKNFRLSANSPAINSGYDVRNEVSTDIEGRPRPAGKFDLGAHEYGANTSQKPSPPQALSVH